MLQKLTAVSRYFTLGLKTFEGNFLQFQFAFAKFAASQPTVSPEF
jgi:hypothetical protein